MAITYPLVMPTLGFKKFSWQPDSTVQVQRNEFTSGTKTYVWPGKIRRASVQLGAMTSIAQAREWQAFFLKLNGQEGTFLMQDPALARVSDALEALAGSYTAKVDGGGQNGNLLQTKDWPVSMSDLLRKGDYIGINVRLHMLLEDVDSDTNGDAELSIWPHADATMLDNTEIWVGSEAFGKFRLLEFPAFVYDDEKLMTDGVSFNCEEAFE